MPPASMYSTDFSRATFRLEAKDMHKSKSKGKGCGYYTRIVFFFSSLIQSLIIVSLVLFLVYGQPEKSAQEKRVQDLQQSFNQLSMENQALKQHRNNLTQALKKEVANNEKELKSRHGLINESLRSLQLKLVLCETEKKKLSVPVPCPALPTVINFQSDMKTLKALNQHQETLLKNMAKNFTQKVQTLTAELESTTNVRDKLELEKSKLKREKLSLSEQLEKYTQKCKEDFVSSLEGIQTVTKAFLAKIDSLPQGHTFQLTCAKQQDQLDRIRSGCTNLSREVENKFQQYLNNVGNVITSIQSQRSTLEVQNTRLKEDLEQCNQDLSSMTVQCSRVLQERKENHENLLLELNKLKAEKEMKDEGRGDCRPLNAPRSPVLQGAKRPLENTRRSPEVSG